MEELEGLKDQMQAVGTSMANAVSDGTSIINRDYLPLSIRICVLVIWILSLKIWRQQIVLTLLKLPQRLHTKIGVTSN